MDRLWTPWRYDYIRNLDRPRDGCVFCAILTDQSDESNLLLYRGNLSFVVLNLFPYSAGHLLLVLNRHVRFLRDTTREEVYEMIDLARLCERALASEYSPEGFNVGMNLGRAAGAGVEHHLHMHVVPRWTGDGNFVSIISETRVLPEELSQTYRRLKPHFSPAAAPFEK